MVRPRPRPRHAHPRRGPHRDPHPAPRPPHLLRSDLALLWLARPPDTPPLPLAWRTPQPGVDHVRIAGFGYADAGEREGLGRLRHVVVPVVWDGAHGASPRWRDAVASVFPDEWVAGHPGLGRDSAGGDSGGPAFLEDGGQRLVAGITSRRASRGAVGGGVYVDVHHNTDWIRRTAAALARGRSA